MISKQNSMASKDFSQSEQLHSDVLRETPNPEGTALKYRHPSVYEAVAGRLSTAGFIPKEPIFASTRDTVSSSMNPIPPEAVLFRRHNAPTRYAEDDLYFANERYLQTELPDSDLLKSLHSYTSDFYSRATIEGGTTDYQSLDGTALLSLGILLEEATRDLLGRTGDLVFTEGEQLQAQEFFNEKTQTQSAPSMESSIAKPSKKRRRSSNH